MQNVTLTKLKCLALVPINMRIYWYQSELPRPIPQNSVESDHGCASRKFFDNAGDNVTLMLYYVRLTLYDVTDVTETMLTQ